MDLHTINTIAAHEVKINVRNRWTLIFATVFGALALAASYFGLVTAEVVGFQGFSRTSASLLNLALYLLPIVSLTMATLGFTGEANASPLLFSQPVSRSDILAGKVIGLFASLLAATLGGFGLAGLVIATQVGSAGVYRYLAFVALTILLTLVFLSLGAMVAMLAGTKAKAFGFALFVWFFFVLFYDLLVIGFTFVFKERTANVFVFLSLFGNPVDMVRVSSLIILDGTTIFGPAGAALVKFLHGTVSCHLTLLAGLAAWIIAPLLIAGRILRRLDL